MKKLDHQCLGPYLITVKISSHLFQLGLPLDLHQIHPMFHISLLEPVTTSEILGHHVALPLPIEIDSEPEFEVKEVLDSCIRWRCLKYLIMWKGYENTDEASTREPSKNVSNATHKLAEFHAKNPTKLHHCPWEPHPSSDSKARGGVLSWFDFSQIHSNLIKATPFRSISITHPNPVLIRVWIHFLPPENMWHIIGGIMLSTPSLYTSFWDTIQTRRHLITPYLHLDVPRLEKGFTGT